MCRLLIALIISSMMLLSTTTALAGAYIGAGLGFNSSDITLHTRFPGIGSLVPIGIDNTFVQPQFSILGGYEYDFNHIFLAGEAHAKTTFHSDDTDRFNDFVEVITHLETTVKKQNSYGFDLRPGFQVNPYFQLFALVGYHWGKFDIKQQAQKTEGTTSGDKSATWGGFDYGLGAQVALSDHLALRSQVKHNEYDAHNLDLKSDSPLFVTDDASLSSYQAEVDLVYTF